MCVRTFVSLYAYTYVRACGYVCTCSLGYESGMRVLFNRYINLVDAGGKVGRQYNNSWCPRWQGIRRIYGRDVDSRRHPTTISVSHKYMWRLFVRTAYNSRYSDYIFGFYTIFHI